MSAESEETTDFESENSEVIALLKEAIGMARRGKIHAYQIGMIGPAPFPENSSPTEMAAFAVAGRADQCKPNASDFLGRAMSSMGRSFLGGGPVIACMRDVPKEDLYGGAAE